MRILYFLPFLLLASCFSEEKVDIGSGNTFIRYYNGGYNDEPVTISKTMDNGYIILSNIALNDGRYKIKLIKTDDQGNSLWTKIYPEFNTNKTDPLFSQRAFGLLVMESGYVLAGENINTSTGRSRVMVMVIDDNGEMTTEETYPMTGIVPINSDVRGIAITENTHPDSLDADKKAKSYIVLGSITDGGSENMIVGGIKKSDLSATWTRAYGNGDSNLTNKIFLDSEGSIFFGGTVVRQNNRKVRLIKVRQDYQTTDFDLTIGDPQFNEFGNDICRYGFGFAVIGTTNKNGDNDILFQRLSEDGTVIGTPVIFPIKTTDGIDVPGNKNGNAISVTQDGGLLLAGTVQSDDAINFGRGGKDLYLIKIDAFGTLTLQKDIGSRTDDVSVAALQADDGGYVVLASTTLAGLKTIMLLKTDNNGNIQ